MYFTKDFWVKAGERCIRAFAVSFLALVGADTANLFAPSMSDKALTALSAAVFSLILSLGATQVANKGDSSFTK